MDNGQLDKQLLLNIVEVLFKMSALFKSADNISLTRLRSRYRSISAKALRAARGLRRHLFFLKNIWQKYFFGNIFGELKKN